MSNHAYVVTIDIENSSEPYWVVANDPRDAVNVLSGMPSLTANEKVTYRTDIRDDVATEQLGLDLTLHGRYGLMPQG